MRLIDAEPWAESIQKDFCDGCNNYGGVRCSCCKVEDILVALEEAPTIEAKPVVHASWVEVSGGRIICDHCGNYPLYDYFERINLSRCCPTCGALMSNGGHWLFRKAEEYLKENNCGAQMDEPISQTHENGVKIPVVSMKDVAKLIEKELPSAEENPILKAVKAIKGE